MDIRMLPIRARLRALPAPGARPRPPAGQGDRADPRGRGHARRQGDHRRDRRAARPHDPQQRRPRHRDARRCASPAARRPTGTILLSATQESNHVLITIMDDGRGIDAAPVRREGDRARACCKGDEALTDREVVQLIFSQGFSTSEAITELSGRGVGLDVVLKSHRAAERPRRGGDGAGRGDQVHDPAPADPGHHLRAAGGGRRPAPTRSRSAPWWRASSSTPEEVHTINGRETLRLRDRIVPLVRLAAALRPPDRRRRRRGYAVIVGRGDKRVGLVVDRLRGQQEVVIKALDPSVSGAAAGAGRGHHHGRRPRGADPRRGRVLRGRRHALVHGRADGDRPAGGEDVMYEAYYGLREKAVPQDARPALPLPERRLRGGAGAAPLSRSRRWSWRCSPARWASGKTLLSRALIDRLGDRYEVGMILNPRLSPRQFLRTAAAELGVAEPRFHVERPARADPRAAARAATRPAGRRC